MQNNNPAPEVKDSDEQDASPADAKSAHKGKRPKRSTGLRVFDVMLYPLITNVGVFVISVAATYLTNKGNITNLGRQLVSEKELLLDAEEQVAAELAKSGNQQPVMQKTASLLPGEKLVYGKTGEFFHKRGAWLVDKFKGMGMEEKTANMSKMVFFSFADGSLLAPVVKLLEDRRERIGRWIDKKLGSEPDDPNVYKSEPKQTWLSVLGGRAATAAIVVNTAVALEAKILKNTRPDIVKGTKMSLNDKLFHVPGVDLGDWINKNPGVKKVFGKHDAADIAKVSIFEAVYTSICTAGLYFSSRLFARKITAHKEKKLAAQNAKDDALPTSTSTSSQDTQPVEHEWASRVQRPVGGHLAQIEKSKEAANNAAFSIRA